MRALLDLASTQEMDEDLHTLELLDEPGRKRRKAVAVAVVTYLALNPGQHFRSPTGPNRSPVPFSWAAHTARLTEAESKRRYRMSKRDFDKLLEKVKADLVFKDSRQALRSRKGASLCVSFGVISRCASTGEPRSWAVACGCTTTAWKIAWRWTASPSVTAVTPVLSLATAWSKIGGSAHRYLTGTAAP